MQVNGNKEILKNKFRADRINNTIRENSGKKNLYPGIFYIAIKLTMKLNSFKDEPFRGCSKMRA